jgi:hypothetical protein
MMDSGAHVGAPPRDHLVGNQGFGFGHLGSGNRTR